MKISILLFGLSVYPGARVTAWNHVGEVALREGLDSMAYQLIAFVLPSQSESKSLESEWTHLQEAEKTDPNIVSFDCELHSSFCKELDVTSFPAIRLYHRDGRLDVYEGDHTAREIAMFLRRAIRPAIFDAPSQQLVDSFTLVDDVVFMVHAHPDDWQLEDRFVALANEHRLRFSFVIGPSFSKTESAVVCYNNLDDARHRAEDVYSDHGLEDFVKLCSEPLIPELTRENEGRYTSTNKSILHYFASTPRQKEDYRVLARPLAKKHAESVQFIIKDANEEEVLFTFGLEEEAHGAKTGLALQNPATGEVYPLKGIKEISAKIIEDFLEDVKSGKLESWSKSSAGENLAGNGKVNGKEKEEEMDSGGRHDEL